MTKTNFDHYLELQLRDPDFAERFESAGEAWDVSLQIARLREQAGLSQKDLAVLLKTSQQQISRLESPSYQGHSLSMLRRVADALHARVRVVFEPLPESPSRPVLRETPSDYKTGGKTPPKKSKPGNANP
jgi:transcriptional regulator with XRE-family HTH domain